MAKTLESIADQMSHRFALRRRMLERMGVASDPDLAMRLQPQIRASLAACAACRNSDICEGWLDQGGQGLPVFCHARMAFQDLACAVQSAQAEEEGRADVAWVAGRLSALQPEGQKETA